MKPQVLTRPPWDVPVSSRCAVLLESCSSPGAWATQPPDTGRRVTHTDSRAREI